VTVAELRTLEEAVEQYEHRIIEAARRAGKFPVIDACAPKYPATAEQQQELRRYRDPSRRDSVVREAASLERKAASLRRTSVFQPERAADMLERAEAHERRARELYESLA
jgi:hypothetical protein